MGDTVGGSHLSTLLLVQDIIANNSKIKPIVVLCGNGVLEGFLKSNNVSYTLIYPKEAITLKKGKFSKALFIFRSIVPFIAFLLRNRIDVVHTNDERMHLSWVLPSFILGVTHVWHQRAPCKSFKVSCFSLFANHLLTISEFCRDESHFLMSRRFKVINNPFSSYDRLLKKKSVLREDLLIELGFDKNVLIISWVANWITRKRPMDFILAAKILIDAGHGDFRFLMFGEPRSPISEQVYTSIRDLGLEKHVFIMGFRTPIEPYIAASNVLVVTAEYEGFGRTLIEAMSLETIVIATNSGGHREIVVDGFNGFLVEVGDVSDIARKILGLQTTDLTSLIQNASSFANNNFSISTHVKAIEKIYNKENYYTSN